MPLKDVLARISKLVVLSYVIDWVFIIGIALIGYGFSKVDPSQHPFSLTDPTIAFPYKEKETVSTAALILAGLLAPAVIVFAGALFIVPGTAAEGGARPSKSQILRRKVWEWNAGWMGLAVSLAGAFMATQGLKSLLGKPRPDMLARCNPDLNAIEENLVGGLGVAGAPIIVSWKICQDQSDFLKVDGFSSFPSGHASFAFSGLAYLTLWFCAKFSVGFPYLSYFPTEGETHSDDRTSVRTRGAAPPVLMMIFALVPTATATFIAASRWANCRHHGFDVLFGSALGIFFAYIGFRMYHLPIQRGAGWAWGPRARRRAFIRGIGFPSSLGTDSWSYAPKAEQAGHNGIYAESNVRDNSYVEREAEHIPMQEQPAHSPVERV
ncbi:hypothetical protein N7533_000393 [Penicillium manginii]|uniref:uncharacterized protein n=1 Tax=Penicillium manginii TaxID=203109 RepID=UPI0025479486|nr:uncharacterized protein N7533_000393 [Penicillium manginii]KAJ5767810.1 hypothetical protein N7533_000393 [Penicillium manginii]